jgi:hypothetical protein
MTPNIQCFIIPVEDAVLNLEHLGKIRYFLTFSSTNSMAIPLAYNVFQCVDSTYMDEWD